MLELLETHVYVLHEQKVSNNRADSSQRGHYVRPRVINSPSREGRHQLSPAKSQLGARNTLIMFSKGQ